MLKNDTKLIQRQLANFAMSKTDEVIPGTSEERLIHYRQMIYNIVNGSLKSVYPIAHNLLLDTHWNIIVSDFIAKHNCEEPQLLKMPFELIAFVEKEDYASRFEIPYLVDLLAFEWVEMEIHDRADVEDITCISDGDFVNDALVYSPYFQMITMEYPIHQLKTHVIESLKGQYFLMVYRDEICEVNYFSMSQFSYLLLSEMIIRGSSLLSVLDPLIKDQSPEQKEAILNEALNYIKQLYKIGIVRGFK